LRDSCTAVFLEDNSVAKFVVVVVDDDDDDDGGDDDELAHITQTLNEKAANTEVIRLLCVLL